MTYDELFDRTDFDVFDEEHIPACSESLKSCIRKSLLLIL